MTYHVYVSQHATYRYTVQADTVEDADEKVTEAIDDAHTFEVGRYRQTVWDWDITETGLSDPWPKR